MLRRLTVSIWFSHFVSFVKKKIWKTAVEDQKDLSFTTSQMVFFVVVGGFSFFFKQLEFKFSRDAVGRSVKSL